jgi:hypothetical protein
MQPSVFHFSTGLPDGKIATISEPSSNHTSQVEFESADDFALTTETKISRATFTGLLTGGATLQDVSNVIVEIYRVFPNDSDVGRTSGPPTFSTNRVPTRVNSPSDVEFDSRNTANQGLTYHPIILNTSFTAQKSVSSPDKIDLRSGGNGPATGTEVKFEVAFPDAFDLPAGHYFFVPQVGLSDDAPAAADFLWLSAPKPVVPPGTPFPKGVTDLQSWMRDDPTLAPDWLRIGTDIIGGAAFNASFSVSGITVPPQIASLSQASAPEGSPDLTITINGSNFTSLSTLVVNGKQPLATTFVSASQLQAIIPAALLADEGHFNLSVVDPQLGSSSPQRFIVTDSSPVLSASITQGLNSLQITLDGLVTDLATEDHQVRIVWGDGHEDVLDLGVGTGGSFSASHTFAESAQRTIVATPVDDNGFAGAPVTFDVNV